VPDGTVARARDQEYLRKARRLPPPPKAAAGSSSPLPIVGGIAILIALAAAVAVGLRRRRHPEPVVVLDPSAVTHFRIDGTKACPECAETIKAAAKVCHYCGERFDESADLVAH